MTASQDLLIELGTEELPPKALRKLSEAFAQGIISGLESAGLTAKEYSIYAAPRRLALLVKNLPASQQDQENVRKGPAVSAAFDADGNPTKAAQGFASSCGVTVEQLDTQETKKGAWLSYCVKEKGKTTASLIPALIEDSLAKLPIPKRMRWGNNDYEFVRPVHWLVILFGDQVVDANILGISSGSQSRGHRFHHPDNIEISFPSVYKDVLENTGQVLVDFSARQNIIRDQVNKIADTLGGTAVIDDALLDEVTALVEWPVALSGKFDQEFLDVPSEALISSMQDHQKYFPVTDAQGKLLPYFITVANIVSKDPSQIQSGNERVIRPRLADAAFFWNQDLKKPLSEFSDGLHKMLFQKQLGSLFQKQERIAALATMIATKTDGNEQEAHRAAMLCKCDLLTNMVGEFPDLQGVMGRYYALKSNEATNVATAIQEHYQPRYAGDALPQTNAGQCVALADRIDSLVGIFAIGQQPSGVKDPFALRRAALGVIRICIEQKLDLDLLELITAAAGQFDKALNASSVVDAVLQYITERLRSYYQDSDLAADILDAVLATGPTHLVDLDKRVKACQNFRALPEAESLAAANKRIRNILKKTKESIPDTVDASLLQDQEEIELAKQLDSLKTDVVPLMNRGEYTQALEQLATLRTPVDAFFDKVMVMVDDEKIRANRLSLLQNLGDLFLRVADLSKLHS